MSNVSWKSYTTAPNLTQWPKMSRYISGPIFDFCPFLSHLGIFKYVLWNRPASVLGPFPPWNVARQCSIMGCTRSGPVPEWNQLSPPHFLHCQFTFQVELVTELHTQNQFHLKCGITPSERGVPEISACPWKSQGVLILGDALLWGHYVA